jgi:hypothetical protein
VLDIVIHFLSCTFYGGELITFCTNLLTLVEVCTTFCTTFHAKQKQKFEELFVLTFRQKVHTMEEFFTSCVKHLVGFVAPPKQKQLNLDI